MSIYQTLGLLIVIILIVWWALRRSAAESNEEKTPVGSGHEEHGEPEHMEHAEHETDAVKAESVEIPIEPVAEPMPVPAPALEVAQAIEDKPDDLVIIEGIGPRISSVLQGAGIKTFTQLSEMKPDQIKDILSAVDERLGRISDPATWPQQAALAARGEMEALQALQNSLKAGRKDK